MRTVPFQQPFGRCPALLTTLAASTQHVRPRCVGSAAAARFSNPKPDPEPKPDLEPEPQLTLSPSPRPI